jgi:hypothetical protein
MVIMVVMMTVINASIICLISDSRIYMILSRSLNTSTTKLAENVKGLMDASAASSAQEFTSLKNITTTFLDAFHALVLASRQQL